MGNTDSFPEFYIDRLKILAHEWAKDHQEAGVRIEKVILYKYRPPIQTREALGRKYGPGHRICAIVFELNCEGKKPTVEILNNIDLIFLANGCKFVPYADFISRKTDYLSAGPRFPSVFQPGFKEIYRDAKTKEEFEKVLIYEWAFYPLCKGIALPSSVRNDEPFLVLFDGIEESLSTLKKQAPLAIPVPDGTQWGQIKFRYVNDDIIQISYPGGDQPFSSTSLGLASKPLLFELFKLFAKSKGTLPPAHAPEQIKANVSHLRKHLESIFPVIPDKPIKDYNKREGWRCNFQIECYEGDSESEPKKISDTEEILIESQKIPAKSKTKYNTDK